MGKIKSLIDKYTRPAETDDDLVVVASYDSSSLAYVDKGVLESVDIPSVIDDDLLMRYVPLATPGIALRVRRRDLARAREALHLDEPANLFPKEE